MKNAATLVALASLFFLAACAGSSGSATSGASPEPGATSAAQSAAPSAALSAAPAEAASVAPGGSPTPEPTATPNGNLLDVVNGAVAVSYPTTDTSRPDDLAAHGISIDNATQSPFTVVFELPTVESIDSFGADLIGVAKDDPHGTVAVAVSTTSATNGFSDVGTATNTVTEQVVPIKAGVKARWVRVTYTGPLGHAWYGISATGAMPGPRTGAPLSGIFVEHDNPYKNGAYDGGDKALNDPWLVRATSVGNGLTMTRCYTGKTGDTYTGSSDGRTFTFQHGAATGSVVINDEGTKLAGRESGAPFHFSALVGSAPTFCYPPKPYGTGKRRVLVLDNEGNAQPYPISVNNPTGIAKYRIQRIPAGFLTAAYLAGADVAMLNSVCDASRYLSPEQGSLIDDWVKAGHVFTIYNADACGTKTTYGFLPYQFETSNPGARGAHGDRLIQVESGDLGSFDRSDVKRFVDASVYAANANNQLGDANTVTTMDDHWCGHLFGTNANHVNGFMQMYAPYGTGFFIFNGFDEDDSGIPQYQSFRDFELGLKLPADLSCSVKVDMSFVVEPNREGTFVAGKATRLPFAMEVLANQGWKGHVTVTTQGGFPTTVTPSSFDMNGGTQALALSVAIPSGTPAGEYAISVIGTDPNGKTSQAVIQLNGAAPLKKIPKKQKRIRLYGIHFDYNSAKIQPRSEPVIKEIADLMKGDKTLRFQVEGHTDSDGGGPYNLKLSQARAQSVVADLIHRYHIAASRLVPKGFGLTQPVASNDTAGGKALNRRVELLRL